MVTDAGGAFGEYLDDALALLGHPADPLSGTAAIVDNFTFPTSGKHVRGI